MPAVTKKIFSILRKCIKILPLILAKSQKNRHTDLPCGDSLILSFQNNRFIHNTAECILYRFFPQLKLVVD